MSDDIQFVDGLIVKCPKTNAPSFVKASISIKVADLSKWLAQQEGEWVNVDVKESKSGKWYAAVNTFKPKERQESKPASKSVEDMESDIPF
jgi:predicted nucleic-acid-binding Zn-ribbon protein